MTKSFRDEILDHYITMLELGWCVVDEEGNVSMVVGDVNLPATIDGKRIVLPTRDQMKNRDWEHRLGFHPLRESFNKGISPILSNMRDLYVQRLNTSIAYLMQEFVAIGKNTDGQKDLTTEQSQVLNALTHCNENTVKTFDSLRKKTLSSPTADQFVNVFIKKGGVVNGQTFGRAAITTFPIYQKLVEGVDKINGVKITGKEREMFTKMYQFIFKDIDKVDGYNVGVSSKTAPFMEALMRGTIKVANEIDSVAEPYLPIVPLPYFITFPEKMNDWIEIFDDKDKAQLLADSIPNLSGNYAEEDEKKEAPRRETSTTTERAPAREESRSEPEPVRRRGPLTMGEMLGGSKPPIVESKPVAKPPVVTTPSLDGRRVMTNEEMDREELRKRREEEDRIRRQRDREEEEDRELRRKRREEDERLDRERRERDRERDRDRDRRYDRDDDRDRDRYDRDDRDRDRGRYDRDDRDDDRDGDVFDKNPVLRSTMRREEDDRDGRRRRPGRDDRGRGNRIRDIRDGGRDRYDRDDRDDDRYYRDRDRYRRR